MVVIFFQHFKDVILLSSGFYHFCWEIVNLIALLLLRLFSLFLVFSSLTMMYLCVFLFVLLTWGLLNFLKLGWSLSFVWPFLSHLSPYSSLLSEVMYFEIPGDCGFVPPQPTMTTLKALWSHWQPLAWATLSSCSGSACAPMGKKKKKATTDCWLPLKFTPH